MGSVKVGDRLTIPNDGHGNPVREYDCKKKRYTDRLQLFEVTGVACDGSLQLKPVWP